MQLTYRGIQYNTQSNPVSDASAMNCDRTATYRGAIYPILPARPAAALAAKLKYRGVAYAQGNIHRPAVYQLDSRSALA